jgi:hypothetical protein
LDSSPDVEPHDGGSVKSAKQRKAEFEERHLNRGGKDPTKPERWAVMVHLTAQAKENLAEMRRHNQILKTGPTTNSAIVEAWLLSDANDDTRTAQAFNASSVAARKTRSAKLQAADLLLRRLETGIGTGEVGVEEIEGAMFREHTVARDRWAASLARAVTARVGADDLQDELRWMFRDAVDDYIHALLFDAFSELGSDHQQADDEEAVEWIRRRLGISSKR